MLDKDRQASNEDSMLKIGYKNVTESRDSTGEPVMTLVSNYLNYVSTVPILLLEQTNRDKQE